MERGETNKSRSDSDTVGSWKGMYIPRKWRESDRERVNNAVLFAFDVDNRGE